jgi:hypothetical protein
LPSASIAQRRGRRQSNWKTPPEIKSFLDKKYGSQALNWILNSSVGKGIRRELPKHLGSGSYGDVFICAYSQSYRTAIKLMFTESINELLTEIYMHKQFYDMGLAPRLIGFNVARIKRKWIGIVEMNHIDFIFGPMLSTSSPVSDHYTKEYIKGAFQFLRETLPPLHAMGYVHGDMHWDNISLCLNCRSGKAKRMQAFFIDFGWAAPLQEMFIPTQHRQMIKDLDFYQLVAGLSPDLYKDQYRSNIASFMRQHLHDLFRKVAPHVFRKNWHTIRVNQQWQTLMDKRYRIFHKYRTQWQNAKINKIKQTILPLQKAYQNLTLDQLQKLIM